MHFVRVFRAISCFLFPNRKNVFSICLCDNNWDGLQAQAETSNDKQIMVVIFFCFRIGMVITTGEINCVRVCCFVLFCLCIIFFYI